MKKLDHKREYSLSGLIAILVANIIWGIGDVTVRIIGRYVVPVVILGYAGFLLLAVLNVSFRHKLSFKEFLDSFPIGVQRSVIWSAMFIAFQQDNPAIAVTIYSFSLVVAIVMYGPLLGEKVTPKILAVSLIGVVGVVLTANTSFDKLSFSTGAIIMLVLLPVGAASTYMLRRVQKKVKPETAATYYFLWVGILVTPVMMFTHPRFGFSNKELLIAFISVLAGAGGHFLYSISQKNTTFQFNAVASSIHSPATAFFTWIILGANLAGHQWAGMAIVMATVVYISIASKSKEFDEVAENISAEI